MSTRALRALFLGGIVLIVAFAAYGVAAGDAREFRARPLTGYQENPDISTDGRGSFSARLSADGRSLTYQLRFSSLEGTVTQSHIHFGKTAINGAIVLWLCDSAANPAPATTDPPTCASNTTLTGTLDASDVIGPATPPGQGIEAGAFDEVVAALRAGSAYVNVHSTKWPGGEIRAQIRAVDD